MKRLLRTCLLSCFSLWIGNLYADNQTLTVSPISPGSALPFQVVIEKAPFQLPLGYHSGAIGEYQGQWVLVAGRVNGMHGFGSDPFPPSKQNTTVFVVNPTTGTVKSRSLLEKSSGLTQKQIDSLSVTSPESYQDSTTLYIAGGYGFDAATSTFNTKPYLTALYLPGIIQWVNNPNSTSFAKNMQQIQNQEFQVTGGRMYKLGNVTQLVFGQNFEGAYTPGTSGTYTQQVRQFLIKSVNGQLAVDIYPSKPSNPNPNYRRRDLNVVPIIRLVNNAIQYGLVAYSGVFTDTSGIWTVPVVIDQNGTPTMADPAAPTTFKQGMNNYASANAGLYSQKYSSMYNIFFGGISYGYYSGGTFQTDSEFPFINQITTVKMDKNGLFSQYLMNSEYPVIVSTTVNPGNPLLFGAGATFIQNSTLSQYPNRVLNLDNIRSSTVIGYIVGGIASTLPNTNTMADSFGSPYVFKVTLVPTT